MKEKKSQIFHNVDADFLVLGESLFLTLPTSNRRSMKQNLMMACYVHCSNSISSSQFTTKKEMIHIVVDLLLLQTSITAIEPGEVNNKLVAMVNSVYYTF